MRDARRAALWLLALLAVTVAGDRILASVLSRIALGSQFRFAQLYRAGTDADIVILGDSRGVHTFYSPDIEQKTHSRTLSLAYNGMSTVVAEAILLDYLDRHAPPKMVILEVTSLQDDLQLMTELRTYTNLSPRLRTLYTVAHPRAAAIGRVFNLYPLNSDFFSESLRCYRRSDQDWIMRTVISPELVASPRGPWIIRPRQQSLDALQRMAALARAKGITLRVVLAPYHPSGMPKDVPVFVAAAERALKAGDPGQHVWNYIGALHDDRFFGDRVHMNYDGSRELLAILERDRFFDLPHHAS